LRAATVGEQGARPTPDMPGRWRNAQRRATRMPAPLGNGGVSHGIVVDGEAGSSLTRLPRQNLVVQCGADRQRRFPSPAAAIHRTIWTVGDRRTMDRCISATDARREKCSSRSCGSDERPSTQYRWDGTCLAVVASKGASLTSERLALAAESILATCTEGAFEPRCGLPGVSRPGA